MESINLYKFARLIKADRREIFNSLLEVEEFSQLISEYSDHNLDVELSPKMAFFAALRFNAEFRLYYTNKIFRFFVGDIEYVLADLEDFFIDRGES